MKRLSILAIAAITVLFTAQVSAGEWGYLSTIPNDHPGESVFRVNIEDVDGKQPGPGVNAPVHPGSHAVKVSLVFNPEWGTGMGMTDDNIYYDMITVTVEADKTYYLGAKVNTKATADEQMTGDFWQAVIYSVE